MDAIQLGLLIGVPLSAHALMAMYAYTNAGKHGMNQRKWGTVAALVPFFGFFMYIFERDEQLRDGDREEMFVDGPFEVHKSRADDMPLASDPDNPTEGGTESTADDRS